MCKILFENSNIVIFVINNELNCVIKKFDL